MTISDEVREKIIKEFTNHLNNHLIANDEYPLQVTIKTLYKDCSQTLTVEFEKITED